MIEEYRRKFDVLIEKVQERKEHVQRLVRWLEEETSYFTSPASSRYHLAFEGGLLIHSVIVTEILLKLKEVLYPSIEDESCVIVGLFHDLGKIGYAGKPLYIPNPDESKRDRKPYIRNPEIVDMSIATRSLYLLSSFVPLTAEEAQAIIYHDGQYVPANREIAGKEEPLTLLINYADSWASFVIEKDFESRRGDLNP